MFDKESKNLNDGQKAPTPSPLRASNTLESLRPREVNVFNATEQAYGDLAREIQETDSLPLQGRGLPPLDYEQPSDDDILLENAARVAAAHYWQADQQGAA